MKTRQSPTIDSFVVNHPDSLLQIVKAAVVKKVVLQLPSLAPNEISYWENRLTAEKNACGCGEATAFLLLMLVAQASLFFSGSSLLPESTLVASLYCVTLALMSIGIGKAFGRYRASSRLKRSVHELILALNNRPLNPPQSNLKGELS
ncbi:MAG TPA: hypothetical protein VIE65_02160 [Methylobacter sp.]|jgi:hypothetical protein